MGDLPEKLLERTGNLGIFLVHLARVHSSQDTLGEILMPFSLTDHFAQIPGLPCYFEKIGSRGFQCFENESVTGALLSEHPVLQLSER